MPKTSTRGGRNNNPTGRNQYSEWGVIEMARERPFAAAAAAAGAAAAGLFLWSKRSQISSQLSSLSDQIGDWTANMGSSSESLDTETGLITAVQESITNTAEGRRGTSETGGGDAGLARRSGGGSASSRGRATPTT